MLTIMKDVHAKDMLQAVLKSEVAFHIRCCTISEVWRASHNPDRIFSCPVAFWQGWERVRQPQFIGKKEKRTELSFRIRAVTGLRARMTRKSCGEVISMGGNSSEASYKIFPMSDRWVPSRNSSSPCHRHDAGTSYPVTMGPHAAEIQLLHGRKRQFCHVRDEFGKGGIRVGIPYLWGTYL